MTELYEDHVDLYDVAFSWDVTDEAAWLVRRLGGSCRSILEPGCGSGRILVALATCSDVEVTGIDRSAAMLAAARRRLDASGIVGDLILADMTGFDLVGRQFDGAVCPINTLAHLLPGDLSRHLGCMGRHLREGARYLVQLDLLDDSSAIDDEQWEMTDGETTLRVTWSTEEIDLGARCHRQRSRIEILSGARAGEVVEEIHSMTAWTPEAWAAAIAASPFISTATYDGDDAARPRIETGVAGRLLWHELTRVSEHGGS